MERTLRPKDEGERCNCENSHCNHDEACGALAGDTFIDQIGYVCDPCAAGYPKKYHIQGQTDQLT